jgi:sugar phosphate isomerase/epimerase
MLKAISTHVHLKERLHPGILERLAKGGIDGIELFAMSGHFDYDHPQQTREIASWFASAEGVELVSMHAPIYAAGESERDSAPLNIAGRERRERIEAMDEIKRALERAEVLRFRFLVLHLGVSADEFSEHKFEGALSSVEHLHAFARPLGVRLLLENIPNELTTPERLAELIHTLHFDDIGVCLDLGHAHLSPGVEESIEMLRPWIRSVHVHDNRGDRDSHLWPGEGTIDFKRTMELLRGLPQPPMLVIESAGDPAGNPEYGKVVAGKMLETWKKLEL